MSPPMMMELELGHVKRERRGRLPLHGFGIGEHEIAQQLDVQHDPGL